MVPYNTPNRTKVSIIVPVYNTANYLDRCMESILRQTHTNLEVIIVNDGSTDKSADICNKYARIDRRVTVIHKKNAGVSSARNLGLDSAKGAYVTFIDSDDMVHSTLVSLLYDHITINNCDVSVCGTATFGEGSMPYDNDPKESTKIISNDSAIANLLYAKGMTNSVFGKMFKTNLFDNVRFSPEFSYAEDLDMTYRLFSMSRLVMTSSAKRYYYLKRGGSAMNSPFSKTKMDCLAVALKIQEDAKTKSVEQLRASELKIFTTALFLLGQITDSKSFKSEKDVCRKIINGYKFKVCKNANAKIQHRLYAFSAIFSVGLLTKFLLVKAKLEE